MGSRNSDDRGYELIKIGQVKDILHKRVHPAVGGINLKLKSKYFKGYDSKM